MAGPEEGTAAAWFFGGGQALHISAVDIDRENIKVIFVLACERDALLCPHLQNP